MLLRVLLIVILLAAIFATIAGVAGLLGYKLPVPKLLDTGSILFGLASLLQLKLSGWFDMVMAKYGDIENFPYGPPSVITRQIIDNPDAPVATYLRNMLFFDAETGFKLAVVSLSIALAKAWV